MRQHTSSSEEHLRLYIRHISKFEITSLESPSEEIRVCNASTRIDARIAERRVFSRSC